MIVLSQSEHSEEREFYLRMAVQEKWSKRELERQFKAALIERSVTQPAKVSAVLKQTHPLALEIFRDTTCPVPMPKPICIRTCRHASRNF